jgi:hypothetical protein
MKCLAIFGCLILGLHPFHLSVTEIFHNPENQSFEISIKLFVDDMEDGIEKAGHGKLFLGTEKEHEKADLFIYDYLLKNIELKLDGKESKFNYLGKEYEPGNVMWCYLEVKKVKRFSKVYLRNHILTEIFEDQQNIVHLKHDGKTKSLRLRKGKDDGELIF